MLRRRRSRGGRDQWNRQVQVESLEIRCTMDARVVISELVADNTQGLRDDDGDRSDWIELYNAGDAPADLTNWKLSDDLQVPDQWTFPSITLQPEQYLILFASGKDRRDATKSLHTNFRLSSEGETLTLTRANGQVESTATYSAMEPDRSFGLSQPLKEQTLQVASAPLTTFVPTATNGGDKLGQSWTLANFDDSQWMRGSGGIGFDQQVEFDGQYGTEIESQMLGVNPSVFMRVPFSVDNPYAALTMRLKVKYDDGYIAYLNGQEIARRNTPTDILWNAQAPTTHRDTLAVLFEEADVSEFKSLLKPGQNILAIQGFNATLTSDDFLLVSEVAVDVPGAVSNAPGRYFAKPTPAAPNGEVSYSGLAAPVSINVERGFYEQAFDVTLTSITPGASLVYTTDGSAPSKDNGTIIPPPSANSGVSTVLRIEKTTTLRAAAIKDDVLTSRITTKTYIFISDVITQDYAATIAAGFPASWLRVEPDYGLDPDVIGPNDLYNGEFARQIVDSLKAAPSISLVMDQDDLFGPNGIYPNSTRSGDEWERGTSFEFIETGGATSVQADAGIQIQGDNVRNLSNSKKQSFRLNFRDEYGPTKLRFPVFGADQPDAVDEFDTLILRGGYNDAWVHTPDTTQYIRDQWAHDILREMGHVQSHGRWVHVYLNGFYWGLYNMVERPNASFSASYSGSEKEEWDTLNTGAIRDGNREAWNQLQSISRTVGDSNPSVSNAAYQRLLGNHPDGTRNPAFEVLLNVDNYIDYLIVNFYGGNTDWPGRNYYTGRRRGPESTGFEFYAWDTEKILNHGEGSDLNTNQTNVADGVALMYRYLRSNPEFRLRFADRVQKHFSPGGSLYVDPANPQWNPAAPEKNAPAADYVRLANKIELLMVAESARWGDTMTTGTRPTHRIFTSIEWRKTRDNILANYFPKRTDVVLKQLVASKLYTSVAAPVFNQAGGTIEPGFQLTMTGAEEIYYTLDGSDPRRGSYEAGGEGVGATAVRYTGPITLNGGTVVKARSLVNGVWTAINEATFTVGRPPLRITELMYHPRDPEAGGLDADEFEYVELMNISSTHTVNLTGMAFTRGIDFTFPANTTLGPGQRAVVVRNAAAFAQRYGQNVSIAGQYGNTPDDVRLSNSGETLTLVDSVGQVIQEFEYSDDWLPQTDGDGYSLAIIDPLGDLANWNVGTSWRLSGAIDGSPGKDDASPTVGDFTGDGRLDASDLGAFCVGMQANDSRFNLTGGNQVDREDLTYLVETVFGTRFGDANLDGRFDTMDLVAALQAAEYEDNKPGNSTWGEGDWDCDGEFTSRDLIWAFERGGFREG